MSTIRIVLLNILFLIFLMMLMGMVFNAGTFALHIFGEDEIKGAKVFVNGKLVGEMERFSEKDSHFSIWLPAGTHEISIEKNGFKKFSEKITVTEGESEYYLDAKLERS